MGTAHLSKFIRPAVREVQNWRLLAFFLRILTAFFQISWFEIDNLNKTWVLRIYWVVNEVHTTSRSWGTKMASFSVFLRILTVFFKFLDLKLIIWIKLGYCASNEWWTMFMRPTVLEIWKWRLLGVFLAFLPKTRPDEKLYRADS